MKRGPWTAAILAASRATRPRSLAAVLSLIAASMAAGGAGAACKLGLVAELPVTMTDQSPVTDTKINGEDARFTIDTGASFSVITPPAAAALGLKLHPSRVAYLRGIGGTTDVFQTTVRAFTIAGVTVPNVEFLVGGSGVGRTTTGLLGQNLLRIADVDIDLANGAIRLMRPDGCGGSALAYWARTQPFSVIATASTTPMSPQTTSTAFVNGQRIKVMFDTGAGTSMLTLAAAKRLGLAPGGPGVTASGASRGIGHRMVETWIAPVASFKIGDEEIRNTKLRIGDTSLLAADMLVGADFFLSHHVYIARGQLKLYFTYNGGPVFDLSSKAPRAASGGPEAAPATPDAPATTPAPEGAPAPTDAPGFSRRAAAFAARRDFAHALEDLDRACALAPTEPGYFYQRGEVRLMSRRPLLAMADFDQALKLRPDDVGPLLARAQLRLVEKDRAGAMADLDTADRAAPRESNERLMLAALYGRAEAFAPAVAQYGQWLKLHREDSQQGAVLHARCRARALWGQELPAALTDCDAALKLMPDNPAILDSRGLVRLRLGDFDRAIADYNASLRLRPKSAWSLYGRGVAKLKKGLAEEGKADIAAATALQANLPDEAKQLGIAP